MTTLRCAFCHGPLEAGVACEGCGTRLHRDCWAQAGACPTLGCGRAAGAAPKPAGRRWRWCALLALVACLPLGLVLVAVDRLLGKRLTGTPPALILTGEDGTPSAVGFAPDGKTLVATFEHTVSVFALPGGERVGRFWLRQKGEPHPGGAAVSPDGKLLAAGRRLHAIPGGEVVGELPFECIAWSPDGARVLGVDRGVAGVRSASVVVAEVRGEPVRVLGVARAAAVFSRDGRRVVTVDGDDDARVWDLATGASTRPDRRWPQAVAVGFGGPRDDDLVFVLDDAELRDDGKVKSSIVVASVDGSRPSRRLLVETIGRGRRYLTAGAFSPDRSVVATGSIGGDVRLWDLQGRRLDDHSVGEGMVTCLAFSPDGRWLASGHHWNTVRVWRLKQE